MPEKVSISEMRIAIREVMINGEREYQLLFNIGNTCLRFNADVVDKLLEENKERMKAGHTIYLPTPYDWE